MRNLFICLSLLIPLGGSVLAIPAAAEGNKYQDLSSVSRILSAGVENAVLPSVSEPEETARGTSFSGIPSYSFRSLNGLNGKIISQARSSVDIVMYSINLKDNVEAIQSAADRGVKIRLIIDEAHVYKNPSSLVKKLMQDSRVEMRTLRGTRSYGVNHNKIVIADRQILTAGSYNWTYGATYNNEENSIVLTKPLYVNGYNEYFEWMWGKARTLAQGQSPELQNGYYGVPPKDDGTSVSLNGARVPAYLFSPGSDSEKRLAEVIDGAGKSLDVVTFTFSSKPLAEAVCRAEKRGLKVRFMMDANMAASSSLAKYIKSCGVNVKVRRGQTEKGAMHDKFAILDGAVLETGSFNWTTNASSNSFENIVFVDDRTVVKAYQDQYDGLIGAASDYAPSSSDQSSGVNNSGYEE